MIEEVKILTEYISEYVYFNKESYILDDLLSEPAIKKSIALLVFEKVKTIEQIKKDILKKYGIILNNRWFDHI